nr:hypothetical protein [Bacillus licheniformis]
MRTFEVLTLLSFVMLFQQKMPGKLALTARICEYWRVGGLAALFKTFEATRHDGRHRRRTKRGYREPVRFGFFNKHLKETGGGLISKPNPSYPEVKFPKE